MSAVIRKAFRQCGSWHDDGLARGMSGPCSQRRFPAVELLPLSLWPWQEAVKAVFLDRVNILSEYDEMVHSPSLAMRLPSVDFAQRICAAGAAPRFHAVQRVPARPLPLPYAAGIRRPMTSPSITWCRAPAVGAPPGRTSSRPARPATLRKGSKLPHQVGMFPKRRPIQPTTFELQENGRAFPPNYLHQSWRDFLYWDSELETG